MHCSNICYIGDIFTAVECGVDVFDGSYVYTATERGHALTYPNHKTLSHNRLHNEDTTSFSSVLPTFEINLNETKYIYIIKYNIILHFFPLLIKF